MPAIISQALQDALNLSSTTLANGVKVTRADGTVIGYTTHDEDAVIDGVTYVHAPGMNITQEAQSNDMAVDNLEIQAVFNDSFVRKIDINAGLYDFAQFEKFIYDYTNVSAGRLIRVSGHLGEFKSNTTGTFSAQLLSSNDVVSQNPLEMTGPMCRANLGDTRCKESLVGNDVFGDPITVTGSITSILDSIVTRSSVTFQNMSGGGSGGTNMFQRSLAGSSFGSCGATSTATATVGDCSAEWVLAAGTGVGLTGVQGAAGLTTNSTVTNFTGLTLGLVWTVSGFGSALGIILNGAAYNKISHVTLNDKLRLSIQGGRMFVYKNDVQIFALGAATPSFSYPLRFGVALGASGSQITNAILTTSSGGGLSLVDSSRTETYRTYAKAQNDPTVMTYRQFANGQITFTSGLNNGLSYKIKDWDPTTKAFTLMRPPGYPVSVGDTYSAVKGCDKLLSTCRNVFANVVNIRAEHALPGPERLIQRP